MSQVYCKLAIIKNILKHIESECEIVMFLHEDSGNRQCDYQDL